MPASPLTLLKSTNQQNLLPRCRNYKNTFSGTWSWRKGCWRSDLKDEGGCWGDPECEGGLYRLRLAEGILGEWGGTGGRLCDGAQGVRGSSPPSRALTAPPRWLAVLLELNPIASSSGLPTWVYSHKDFGGI